MAIAAGQARLLTLTMRKSNLEYRLMSVSNEKSVLAQQSANYQKALIAAYSAAGVDTSTVDFTNDPTMIQINALDAQLDQEQKMLETQQQAAAAEIQSVEKLVQGNIKNDFKVNFGG